VRRRRGDIPRRCSGDEKAELLAGARALLLPTKLNDACPLVIMEALVSGTPVIASGNGACPELVSGEVGFLCRGEANLRRHRAERGDLAGSLPGEALRDYHYLRMARDYVPNTVRNVHKDAFPSVIQ